MSEAIDEARAESKRAYNRARYAGKREHIKAQSAAYRAKNVEKTRASGRSYSERHREKRRLDAARYRDPVKAAATTAAWRAANPERAKATIAAWYAAHPDAYAIKSQNRRERTAGGRLSRGLRTKLLVLQKWRCVNCRCDLRSAKCHMDHKTPLAKGGRHEDGNIQLLCASCNARKGAKDPVRWAQENGRLL